MAAYRTAEWFILSTEASKLSVDGLMDALSDINAVRDEDNPNLRLLGVIMCKVDSRTRMAAHYTEQIRKGFSAAGELGAFDTLINRATAVERAQAQGKTLFQMFSDHKVTQQFRDLAQEILSRLEQAEKVDVGAKAADVNKEVVNA